jgi:hypothetical protein
MRIVKLAVVVSASAALLASDVHAQVCIGLPSFGTASIHVNAAFEFPDSANAVAIGVGGGRDNNVFANVGAGLITYEGFDGQSIFGFLELGYQIGVSRLQICPVVSGYLGSGPDDDDFGIHTSTRGIGGGIAAGLSLGSRSIALIPNVAVRYGFDEVDIEEEGIEESLTETFEGGSADVGLSIVFGDRVSLQPIIHFPFGSENTERSFGIFAAVRFPWIDWF